MMFSKQHAPRPVLDQLRRISLFDGCTDDELQEVDGLTVTREVAAGTVLCREGRVGLQAFVIVSGEARVTIGGVEVACLGPGSFFGEMAILDRAPRVGTVVAATPMTVLVLNATELTSLVRMPRIARSMLATVHARLRLADQSLAAAQG